MISNLESAKSKFINIQKVSLYVYMSLDFALSFKDDKLILR